MDLEYTHIKCGSKTVVGTINYYVHFNRLAKSKYALGSLWGIGRLVVHLTTTNMGMERSYIFSDMVPIDSIWNCWDLVL